MKYRVLPGSFKSQLCHTFLDYDRGCGGCPLQGDPPYHALTECSPRWRDVEFNPHDFSWLWVDRDDDDKTVHDMAPHEVDLAKQWIRTHVRKQLNSKELAAKIAEDMGISITNNQLKQLMVYYGFYPEDLRDHDWKLDIQLV